MKNIIPKTILKTVLIILGAAIIAFGVASLGFPSQMAGLFENMGAYSFATGYASLAYTYSGKTEDLARCVEDSVFAHDDRNIVSFGDRLVASGDFEDFCSGRQGYKQLIMGSIAQSKYRLGDKQGALNLAKKAVEGAGFPKPNALAALALEAYSAGDRTYMDELCAAVNACTPNGQEETGYKSDIIKLLTEN